MRAQRRLRQLVQRGIGVARRAAGELGPASRRLADRLAYRPREIVVVALLAGGLCVGLAVEHWRARHPETAARLEAEPPRATVAVAPATMRTRPRAPLPRCEVTEGRAWRGPWLAESVSTASGLDLNRATPGELARLVGISWSLAARIVAARDTGELVDPRGTTDRQRGRSPRGGRWAPGSPALPTEPESIPSTLPDPEPGDGASDAPAE
jgi:hypothetical protein